MLVVFLSVFIGAFLAPFVHRLVPRSTGKVLALLLLGLLAYLFSLAFRLEVGPPLLFDYPWVPSLGIGLSFLVDGLSLLFALIIVGVGALVLVYSDVYLAGHREQGRFFALILLFMASMLGLVLADNLIAIVVFWELTSVSSYMLIGFDHDREAARQAAWQALLVTGFGGIALLAGLVLLGLAAGSFELSELLSRENVIRDHQLYVPVVLLVLAGAFTKSAQFPFHFWLPNAMEAPTPVSTYLHSATMVKAGIYLLARFSPLLGGTALWFGLLVNCGAATMLVGGYLAVKQTDLKRILAYSTVSVLGALVLLIGLGVRVAIEAAVTYLVIHCLYKAALFLVAGIVDHEAGTRDVRELGGLHRSIPVTAFAAGLAALSMAGLPPLFGFIGKELIYEATLETPVLMFVAIATNVFLVVVAGMVGLAPFWGRERHRRRHGHKMPVGLWLGPVLLAVLGLFIGLFPGLLATGLVSPAVGAILARTVEVELALLHGLTLQLGLSAFTFGLGVWAYLQREKLAAVMDRLDFGGRFGPGRLYQAALRGMNILADYQTRLLQNGHLHLYLLIVILTTVGLLAWQVLGLPRPAMLPGWPDIRFYEATVGLVMLGAVIALVRARSRLIAVVALGVVGYCVTLIYIMFGAPDLAMTQFSIDTLTVILLVLVVHRLPRYVRYSTAPERIRDAVPAIAVGLLITGLTLLVTAKPVPSRLSSYFAENSYVLARGHNIVNVILVDFRALDTLGEITVLAVAAIGVYSLLKLRLGGTNKE
jgi:multicomponent Na+:H+ antiporter subunit A